MPADTATTLEIGALITGLGGGLALFLYGMRQMTEALKIVAGGRMKTLLGRLTANRFTAAVAGTVITAVIQSSSVTTVLVVGFVSAGLMTFSQSIGVIIGANIGTTITAQIVAFKVYKYGLLLIAFGFGAEVLSRSKKVKQWGTATMGLGLIFFGMELMSGATSPLREWPPFIDAMQNLSHPLLAILGGMVFTAVVQSSSATSGIVIVLASQGLITLETGIALLFGANIGTCVTAILSALGRPREALQSAWVHVIFNVGGVMLWVFFIEPFADIVRAISPVSEQPDETARRAVEAPRQIANALTLFNILNALVFIWFTTPLARFVHWLVPARAELQRRRVTALDDYYLQQPALALDQVRRELVVLAQKVRQMLDRALEVAMTGRADDVHVLAQRDDEIDELHGAIVTYLGRLSQTSLVDPQPRALYDYIGIANYLENLADAVESTLVLDAEKRIGMGVVASDSTMAMLRPLHAEVCKAFDQALAALETSNEEAALAAVESKERVRELAEKARVHVTHRLTADEPNRLAAYQIETDVIETLSRLNTLTRRVARLTLELDSHSSLEPPAVTAKPEDESADAPADELAERGVGGRASGDTREDAKSRRTVRDAQDEPSGQAEHPNDP